MSRNSRSTIFILTSLMALLGLLAMFGPAGVAQAQTPTDPAVAPIELPAVDPLNVSGDIIAAGSSTVFPLAERMAERFQDEGYADQITIDSIGSGAGFSRFCEAGETDIATASRAIKDSEVEKCAAIGRKPVEFRVGTDAIAIAVSSENDFLTDVTLAELAQIFSTAQKWSDVRKEWPVEDIQRFIPGTDSGTFDYFVEAVMDKAYVKDATADKGKGEAAILKASNLQLSEDDNVLVQGIEGSPYAIGFFGYAYYNENADKLNALSVEGVAPTAESAEDGSYALSRPLFIYSDAGVMAEKPQVADFINFFLTNVNDEISDVGYFPASETSLNEAKTGWLTAMGLSTPTAAGVTVTVAELPEVDPLNVTGDIIAAGSSTVFPLAERMAERFQEEGYADQITIDSIGSGAGFSRFCEAGETDIATASRAIKDSELEKCAAIGRYPLEFRVGTDAIAIAVSSENDFLTDVTLAELAQIFSTAQKWSDVRKEWPVEDIQRFIPGTDSGTFDYFVEAVMDKAYVKDATADKGKGEAAILKAANLQLSEDDNVLVQGIEGSPYAIGFFGYAYYNENADKLNALSVEGVAPTAESAEDNTYALSRPLFIYSDGVIMNDKPQVAQFINFFLTNVNDEISEVGYFPASEAAMNEAKNGWLTAMGLATVELPEVDPLNVSGDIIAAGSSTVFPLAERMAERFQDEGYADQITIDSIGSGAGFSRFCEAGETDIATASRAIKDSEVEKCAAIGRKPIEFRVGTDAIAIAVSSENDFLTDVTLAELAQIFSTAQKWSDVRKEWPAEDIQRFIPGTDSGTFDYFVEAVMDKAYVKDATADKGKGEEAILKAANLQLSEDDNVLVQGIEGSPYAIGFFGYAYYNENADKLNALSIDAIAPTARTAEDNTYALSRPLFIYSDAGVMTSKPQVADFINFFLTNVNDEISDVGYFPASNASLTEAKTNWLTAVGQ